MPPLLTRSLAYYWRTNAAVALGVATAASVLAGALLVGTSVRASLRELFVSRLGRTDLAITSSRFFHAGVADSLTAGPAFTTACPLVVLEGLAAHESSGRRAAGVMVYGLDERFLRFQGRPDLDSPEGEGAFLSPALASDLGAAPGDALIVRVEAPILIPGASLFGRRDERGRAVRVAAKAMRPARDLGEFSLRPQQQAVRAIFVPLRLLQGALQQPGRVNTVLLAGPGSQAETDARLRAALDLHDLGLRLRPLPGGTGFSLEGESGLLGDELVGAARSIAEGMGLRVEPVLSTLAVSIRCGPRAIPYSLISGREAASGARVPDDALLLNEWAARDLDARPGDEVTVDYLLWEEQGRLVERSASLRLAGIVPTEGTAAPRDLVPEYPGISDAAGISDWDPPFPIDLRRIRPRDEEYWTRHRTAPKALLSLARAQQLFGHRLGKVTSLRLYLSGGEERAALGDRFTEALRAALDPLRMGFAIDPVRARGLAAATGATDFGEYFVYFSMFLVWAALLLAGLFFRLGVEQRLREVGLLRALGFSAGRVRAQFLGEGLVLAVLGAAFGLAGAAAYAGLLLLGLRTLWLGAVGTQSLRLQLSTAPLAAGALGAVASALLVTAWTLRGLERVPARRLLSGERDDLGTRGLQEGRARLLAAALFTAAALFVVLSARGTLSDVLGFFGAGLLLLAGFLCAEWSWLNARRHAGEARPGWQGLVRLGFRGASHRPGRSLLSVALIASATFLIVAVSAFRREGSAGPGTGGYALVAESLLPLHHDPGTREGRAVLGLEAAGEDPLAGVVFARFRVRPGDDVSCLNLYRPQVPRILAPAPGFIEADRFAFQSSLARTPEEKANPWRLLERDDGPVPVIADGSSLTYVLHHAVGDEVTLDPGGRGIRVRFVGALRDSVLQGELLMAEKHFLRLFPGEDGYRFFLIDAAAGSAARVTAFLESRLSDLGFDATPAGERLAGFHRVENTYLSTFQALGGLGLLLGTMGLAAVLVRNVLERRRELALLRAVGYRQGHLALLVLAENLLLLVVGLATGAISALVAIAPAVSSRGGEVPVAVLGVLLSAVLLVGALVSALAVQALHRAPLLAALRAE